MRLILAAFIVGCAAALDAEARAPLRPSPDDAVGQAMARYAEEAWTRAGVVLPRGPVRVVRVRPVELAVICAGADAPPGAGLDGCTVGLGGAPIIILDETLPYGRARDTLVHELGHVIRDRAEHLACYTDHPATGTCDAGPDVMCRCGGRADLQPTARDVRFVTGGR